LASELNDKLNLLSFDERLKDLKILYILERSCVSGSRLDARWAISLSNLRSVYPNSARRMRDELLMGEEDMEAIIDFVLHHEDQIQDPALQTSGNSSKPPSASDDLRHPDEGDASSLSM
jgi:hypothetical protein